MSNDEEQVEEQFLEDTDVQEEADQPYPGENERFEVSSYGWDVDVEGLVKRMNRGDIYVPGFQRGFVWSGTEKSRFIESLILGLPVPTLFLARDADSNKLNIIDGQQRLRTLQAYLNGEFSLSGKEIPDDLKGRYYSSRHEKSPRAKILDPADERTLSDAVIHSIVIRPNPKDDDTELGGEYNKAIIQVFKRLNTSGKALTAQEVRASIFHGELLNLVQSLNDNEDWRALFGTKHSRMKDQEAVLRAIALYQNGEAYKSSMPKFLDGFMEANRHMDAATRQVIQTKFEVAVRLIREKIGDTALKRSGTFMLTRFDALAVGLMSLVPNQVFENVDQAVTSVEELLGDRTLQDRLAELEEDTRGLDEHGEEVEGLDENERGYAWSVAKFTNDTNRVSVRLRVAKEVLAVQ
ncbi:DUF262 domain-containing protein [Thalassorhabdomicrobium marinisediminis]|jgi:hypothetical protein|uniref:DUF262 domain-containing protein n=1 Tax=Thalassorhabdomicrobium marinisediminis TaxID=2170577 RepID=UPI0024912F73|nr:DUF262 domain-containing protein [Thalassorhabdomicrobium marinisediminis]